MSAFQDKLFQKNHQIKRFTDYFYKSPRNNDRKLIFNLFEETLLAFLLLDLHMLTGIFFIYQARLMIQLETIWGVYRNFQCILDFGQSSNLVTSLGILLEHFCVFWPTNIQSLSSVLGDPRASRLKTVSPVYAKSATEFIDGVQYYDLQCYFDLRCYIRFLMIKTRTFLHKRWRNLDEILDCYRNWLVSLL